MVAPLVELDAVSDVGSTGILRSFQLEPYCVNDHTGDPSQNIPTQDLRLVNMAYVYFLAPYFNVYTFRRPSMP